MKNSQAFDIIEQAMGFRPSDEQQFILFGSYDRPTLINSCAGAGKTTTLMMSIIYNALIHDADPKKVLGVTFSQTAQQDMEAKYYHVLDKLIKVYPEAKSWGSPKFKTFHALFLTLLKHIEHQKDLPVVEVKDYQHELYQEIDKPVDVLTDLENVKRFTDVASSLINFGYSTDGLSVNYDSQQVKTILNSLHLRDKSDMQTLLTYLGHSGDDYYETYQKVITNYQELKHGNQELDFDDMQSWLKRDLQTSAVKLKVAQKIMRLFKAIYLDEFQDINPLQWSIFNLLLNQNDLNKLVIIGDDDQSIYSFRGSDTSFILNFADKIKDAQTYALSTNYRTRSEILDVVKPLIESNRLRLDKSLQAEQSGGEVLYGDRSDPDVLFNDEALHQFMLDVKADTDHQKTFAILSRTNLILSLVTDKLASRGVYFKLNKSTKTLQDMKLYQTLIGVMRLIAENDFAALQKYAKCLGWRPYDDFLHDKVYPTLDDYLHDSSATSVKAFQKIVGPLDTERMRCHQAEFNDAIASLLPKELLATAAKLTERYFAYMMKRHYVNFSPNDYNQVINYLTNLASQSESLPEFFAKEDVKAKAMRDLQDPDDNNPHPDMRLRAITMHSSKGLEFNETLIYETEEAAVSPEMLELARDFPADTTMSYLKDKLVGKIPALSIKYLIDLATFNTHLAEAALYYSPEVDSDKAMKLLNNYLASADANQIANPYRQELDKLLTAQNFSFDGLLSHDAIAKMLLMELVANAKAVEEEKRIYYVAVTRAKQRVIFDQPRTLPKFDEQLNLKLARKVQIDPTKS